MKVKNKILLCAAFLLVFTGGFFAASAAPGTQEDPLVSQSYVDAQIEGLKSQIASSGSGAAFSVVTVKAGQKVLGGEGTEIIVRSGDATAIDNGVNGVSDLSSGIDLKTGQRAQLDHLLLVPRNDGRGIQAQSELYIMVRGSYTLQ